MELDARYRFDNYVVGPANHEATAAAREVAEAPGGSSNPLVICGAAGVGKTHLLGAIAAHAVACHPGIRVDAHTAEEFVRRLHAAVTGDRVDAFRARCREADLLIIDDIQLLAGRRETQLELARLCRAMYDDAHQVILACDRPLSAISDLDPRLVQRLASGLVVTIGPPEIESPRLAPRPIARPATPSGIGYQDFLSDVADAVARHVEEWRARLAEAVADWSRRGYRVDVLERALRADVDPDTDALLRVYTAAVDRLQTLETEAELLGVAGPGTDLFRDPERVAEAEALVADARANGAEPAGSEAPSPPSVGPVADPLFLNDEKIILDWPDPAGRLIEEWR